MSNEEPNSDCPENWDCPSEPLNQLSYPVYGYQVRRTTEGHYKIYSEDGTKEYEGLGFCLASGRSSVSIHFLYQLDENEPDSYPGWTIERSDEVQRNGQMRVRETSVLYYFAIAQDDPDLPWTVEFHGAGGSSRSDRQVRFTVLKKGTVDSR